MVEAAFLPLPYPEAGVVEEDTLTEQNLALAAALPHRPLVLGGCCCAHVGVIEGLAARHDRLAVAWFDAHGDLNTPETSPSGNLWGMPLRMLLDSGTIEPGDVALVGARELDPPEEEFIAESGVGTGVDSIPGALDRADAVYVALDVDALEPGDDVVPFMPTPGGLSIDETVSSLAAIADTKRVVGAGFTGLAASPRNAATLVRFSEALGF